MSRTETGRSVKLDASDGDGTFEMYCEQMTFTYLGGTPVGEPAPTPTNSP